MKKQMKESATGGGTSAGAIASVPGGFNFPLHKRIPPTNLFGGYSPVPQQNTKNNKKKR
ncbi:hypothetical protein NVP2275O_020 [Vibrio phage 2.275.O._10N.286.54.E11]|nr:hypothetical protein NVP2275O_020 [Vibrio phage 2.275.O._10N.286.54.E11]